MTAFAVTALIEAPDSAEGGGAAHERQRRAYERQRRVSRVAQHDWHVAVSAALGPGMHPDVVRSGSPDRDSSAACGEG